eukprot:1554101-Rhodomonas_salina.1
MEEAVVGISQSTLAVGIRHAVLVLQTDTRLLLRSAHNTMTSLRHALRRLASHVLLRLFVRPLTRRLFVSTYCCDWWHRTYCCASSRHTRTPVSAPLRVTCTAATVSAPLRVTRTAAPVGIRRTAAPLRIRRTAGTAGARRSPARGLASPSSFPAAGRCPAPPLPQPQDNTVASHG